MSPDGLKPPPEEKLLRLIRGKGGHPAATTPGPGSSASVVATPPSWMSAVRGARQLNWFQAATITLAAIVALEAAWVVIQLVRPLPAAEVAPAAASTAPAGASGPVSPELDMPSLTATAARPLFTASPDIASGGPRAAMSGSAKVLASRLTLTGIVAGATPQAIIEDTQTQKTYLVSVGQPLAEGAVLDQILDNRVILDFNGEKVELAL